MSLTSPAFQDAEFIPVKYTCQGDNSNPALDWANVPEGTACFVLMMEDPDVPRNIRMDGLFIHWLVWNIRPTVMHLDEHTEPDGVIGLNTRGTLGYIGPCPPDRLHRYFFRLYALDAELTLPSTASKGDVMRAMEGHILDQAELMGRYEKK
jgi:Raf kinase inhibitor-like YbhB/YbcL family protein